MPYKNFLFFLNPNQNYWARQNQSLRRETGQEFYYCSWVLLHDNLKEVIKSIQINV